MALVPEDGTGVTGANGYSTRAQATAYFADHLYSTAWTAASDANKDKAIVSATTIIDSYFRFSGQKASTAQALEWPRENVYDRDGNLLPSNQIPTRLIQATAEMAQSLLVEDRTQPDSKSGMTRLKADTVEMEWDAARKPTRSVVPSVVAALLAPLGRTTQGWCREVGRS